MRQPVYAPGTIVAGRYRIDKAIARGGCSIVYRGTHIEMGRSVALKIMSAGDGQLDRAWTQRFQREARLASQLRHPNTIIIYDYGHDQGLWFIAMEWVEGASLRNVIKDMGPIDAKRTARLTVQMLKSLTEAHRQGILHRDLKPSNIMLTTDMDGLEVVKVLDFGLAKVDLADWQGEAAQLKLTRDGDFVGTPRYASPEQLKGHELTRASDIYGVGQVMWEMLTGKPAVPEIDYATCVEYHLGPKPWMLPPGVYPPGLATIVERALIKDPTRRFQSCEEMSQYLSQWMSADEQKKVNLFEEEPGMFDGILEFASNDTDPDLIAPSAGARRGGPPVPPKEPRERGRREMPAHRGLAEDSGGFADVDARDLDIDRTVSPLPSSSTQNERMRSPASDAGRPPTIAPKTSSPRGNQSPVILAVGVGALLVVVLGAGAFFLLGDDGSEPGTEITETDPDATTTGTETTPVGETTPNAAELEAKMNTRSPNDLLTLLRRDGWMYGQPETTSLAGIDQTTLRMRNKRSMVDVTFYELDNVKDAKDFEFNTKRPAEAVRFGLTVVRMTPVGDSGVTGVGILRRRFLQIKGLAGN